MDDPPFGKEGSSKRGCSASPTPIRQKVSPISASRSQAVLVVPHCDYDTPSQQQIVAVLASERDAKRRRMDDGGDYSSVSGVGPLPFSLIMPDDQAQGPGPRVTTDATVMSQLPGQAYRRSPSYVTCPGRNDTPSNHPSPRGSTRATPLLSARVTWPTTSDFPGQEDHGESSAFLINDYPQSIPLQTHQHLWHSSPTYVVQTSQLDTFPSGATHDNEGSVHGEMQAQHSYAMPACALHPHERRDPSSLIHIGTTCDRVPDSTVWTSTDHHLQPASALLPPTRNSYPTFSFPEPGPVPLPSSMSQCFMGTPLSVPGFWAIPNQHALSQSIGIQSLQHDPSRSTVDTDINLSEPYRGHHRRTGMDLKAQPKGSQYRLPSSQRMKTYAVPFEPGISRLQKRCEKQGADKGAIALLEKLFPDGITLNALTRQKTLAEIENGTFGTGTGKVFTALLERTSAGGEGVRHNCRLCHCHQTWKYEKDVLRHLRRDHFGLSDVCERW
jgi:hypothetical protein